MVNALVYHLASGQAFFSGVALVLLALSLSTRVRGRWIAFARTLAACMGLVLIAASATPLPAWFYAGALTLSFVWLVAEGSTRGGSAGWKPWVRIAVGAVWVAGAALEFPAHLTPTMPRLGAPTVDVVGDSLSAGIGREDTWPRMLARRRRLRVNNLSVAGTTAASASGNQADRLSGPGSLVVAEIGGNDLLGGTTPDAFERGLDVLLARLRQGCRTVVMLELPLPPFYNAFGAAQRRSAKRQGALLVPKRVLLGVLTTDGATLDTIHLSRHGHELLAERVWGVIRGAVEPDAGQGSPTAPGETHANFPP